MENPIFIAHRGARIRYRFTAISAITFISMMFPKPSNNEIIPTTMVNHPKKDFSCLIKIPIPVSYTHLDVYKRQDQGTSQNFVPVH